MLSFREGVVGCRLPVVGCQLPVAGCRLWPFTTAWLLEVTTDYRQLTTDNWKSTTGNRQLATDYRLPFHLIKFSKIPAAPIPPPTHMVTIP
jgi:hypothetical protein